MSLLSRAKKAYIRLIRTETDDGLGGTIPVYAAGDTIYGAMVFDASTQGKIAQAQGVTSVYTLITSRDTMVMYHDVLRRVEDGKIFRVTSDGDDRYTPSGAGLDMRAVTCEEWTLPEGTDG